MARFPLTAQSRPLLLDVAIVAVVHAAACAMTLALGFDHVSDDDYARVTIAQSFAHAPRLDPSGTSWLPFPFWVLGTSMVALGRSLSVARGASIALASLAATLPYLALRSTGVARGRALLAVAFATLSPWSLWLGAATVPESFTASFTAAAAIGLGAHVDRPGDRKHQIAFAIALLAACLSRYEAWPVAAVLAVVLAVRASRDLDRKGLLVCGIVAVGPIAWMAWNAHAHGDAFHFFERVARFKRALGEGSPDTFSALLLYPRLFVTMRPDLLVAIGCAFAFTKGFAGSRSEVLKQWRVPLICAAAQIAFLAYGNARDGAPAHHSERALLGVAFISAAFAADAISRAPRLTATLGASAWLLTSVFAPHKVPGAGAYDDRTSQIAAGRKLREEAAEHVTVTPCAYEHFALVAAFGAPERVDALPRTGADPSPSCPLLEKR